MEIADLYVSKTGEIFISDRRSSSVFVYTQDGKLIKKVGRKGEGPGEFRVGPGRIAGNAERLLACDFTTQFINIFTLDLKYLETVKVNSPVFDFDLDSTGNIYISSVKPNPKGFMLDVSIYHLNKKSKNFEMPDEKGINPFLNMAYVKLLKDKIAIIYSVLNKLLFVDLTGSVKNIATIKSLPSKAEFVTNKKVPFKLPEASLFLNVAKYNQYLFILAGKYSKNPGRDLYIVDDNGNLIQILTLPEKANAIFIDEKGYLYACNRYGGKVIKYRLKWR